MEGRTSQKIEEFTNFIRESQSEYKWCEEQEHKREDMTQDILHRLELEEMGYHERAKLSTQLAEIRRERRKYKDTVEELAPVMKYIEENRKLLNGLEQLLGAVRKMEKYHDNRSYHPRVLK